MIKTILAYVITFFIGVFLTFIMNKISKKYKSEKVEGRALRMLLQNNLTNLAFVCLDIKYIMDYQLENWCAMLEVYEALDGDGFIHSLDKKIKSLPVKQSGMV